MEGQEEGKSKEGVSEVEKNNALDLVFCLDCTGSMGSYINSARENIINISEKIVAAEKVDVRFGLVAYRDHPPQDTSYITRVFDFTKKPKTMRAYLAQLSASGGGDGPEAVTAALFDAAKMAYRDNATKIVILIADAPPHGLGCGGDGFPDGDPDGKDPLEIARRMAENDIIAYTVGCEPSLGGFQCGRDFFAAIARITEGQFLPLSCADLLNDVIIGGALEEISLERLRDDVDAEVEALQAMNPDIQMTEEEMIQKVMAKMQARGVKTRKVKLDILYENFDQTNVDHLAQAVSLKEARKVLDLTVNAKLNYRKKKSKKKKKNKKGITSKEGAATSVTRRRSYSRGSYSSGGSDDDCESYSESYSESDDGPMDLSGTKKEKEKGKTMERKSKKDSMFSSLSKGLKRLSGKKDKSTRNAKPSSLARRLSYTEECTVSDDDTDDSGSVSRSASSYAEEDESEEEEDDDDVEKEHAPASIKAPKKNFALKASSMKAQKATVEDVLIDSEQIRRVMHRNTHRKNRAL